jgi:hypothetical protein
MHACSTPGAFVQKKKKKKKKKWWPGDDADLTFDFLAAATKLTRAAWIDGGLATI